MAYTTIKKPSDYFNTVLYTGNGSTQSITGVGFQPDWIWVKERSSTSSHQLIDAVRGYNKRLSSNTSDAEAVDSSPYNDFKSIDSDGFTIGSGGAVNENSQTYASWNWLANNTSGSSNTDGSITSTVSVNTTSGFSIVSYTGTGANATVGHGLGSTPKFVAIKNRTTTGWSWRTYHVDITPSKRLFLNTTDAATTDTTAFNSTAPTSSVFSVGTSIGANGSSDDMIAYCFSEVKGFSKFGSYVGNGNTDGTFVYTGFKPAFVIVKNTTTAAKHWVIHDNKRNSYNPTNKELVAQDNFAEYDNTRFDFVSNGLKIRSNTSYVNTSGDNYIYMAFAEEPLVGDNPATAR